ncbi:SNF2-related protein [Ideonella sp. DXS29W]|uniref:SNF2-related protein n=1 Tax=Ideonella lacteola TaxID=2984193 RepID=A0ABU9BU04_9BURK
MQVKGSQVRAQVQGSRAQPYVVEIKVPPTPAADAARLVERLATDPGLIGRLLNRELDPAVLEEARRLKIAVFPSRWSDLRMQCSCPDWAVPCKHLAAVVYVLSREIDGDPFLVFSLRGLDLPSLMREHGIQIDSAAGSAIPNAKEVLFAASAPAAASGGDAAPDPSALARLDFTTLPDLHEPLWRVLPASPVFFRGGDFRAVAQRVMARVAKHALRLLDTSPPTDGRAPIPEGRLQLLADAQGRLAVTGAHRADDAIEGWSELLMSLGEVAPARLPDLPTELAALHTMRLLALHLLARGAVVPQVFQVDAGTVALRWCAAELDSTVRGMVAATAGALPSKLVQKQAGRRKAALDPDVQVRLLLSAMLDHFVAASDAIAAEKAAGDKVLALFFKTGRARFDGPGEAAVAVGIHAWLARLHLAARSHVPVLSVGEHEDGDGFALSLAVAEDAALTDAPTPLAQVLKKPSWASRRAEVLGTVAMLAEFHPPLNDYVRQGAKEPLVVEPEALPSLLFDTLPALRLMGIRTLLSRSLDRLLRPRLSMQLKAKSGSTSGLLDTSTLFSFDWKVSLGDELVTPAEFERLLGRATGIVKFRGQYVYLDPSEVEQLRARLTRPSPMSGAELLRVALAGEFDGVPIGLNKAAEKVLKELTTTAHVPLPKALRATLRPYQERGFAWLWRNARMGLGSVIADDMGLGKTLQVIALLQRLKEDGALDDGRALVIVPTSLLTNWQKEVERFSPSLRVGVFHGAKRELATARPDVLLTTYGVARREAALLKGMRWRLVVIDEAQNIKNAATAQSKAIKSIPAGSYVAMSGTPVENQLSEYWAIMDFAQRGYLGGPTHFAREYATPIEVHRDAAAAERLRKVMAPFMLRRLKSDKSIISDLPDKVEQDQFCTLTRQQAALYESVVREGLASIEGESDTFQRQGLVLHMILALKQVCNHPAHYLKQRAADAAESGKAERLIDLLEEIHSAQEKVLVFTQFREMGLLLQAMLRERLGHEPLFLHGGVARGKRDQMVDRFQNKRTDRVFLLSLKAGGTGLNLTAANHVVHFDLWWNPAVEAQATDRAYRIGQQRRVQVHRFITRGTFEERINLMIRSKRELADMTVGSGETWIGQLPPEELRTLFRLD